MLGDRIKKLRKDKKLTQEELGRLINVTKVSVSGYESGNRNPDTETLQKIADVFGVTTDYLLGREDNKTSIPQDLTEKDERDIAKRMEQIRKDLTSEDGLMFNGDPMSEEAIESFLEAMEYAVRQTQRINKKYIPKKYRDNEEN